MIHGMYAHNDSRRGADATALWLVEEVGELCEAVRRRRRGDIEEELADVFAWVLSLANLFEVNLESAFLKKYEQGCPSCGREHCVCPD
jgi:NTP pyrophosphatase (non-canonical NTP hydrolase)